MSGVLEQAVEAICVRAVDYMAWWAAGDGWMVPVRVLSAPDAANEVCAAVGAPKYRWPRILMLPVAELVGEDLL